ncbi:MAG: SDR family NAD(P)-dependent oxidoreductase [Streptosporangiaceae bacterium]
MVQTAAEIIAAMHEAVPRGRQRLTGEERQRLASLTQALLASKPEAQGEYGRFLAAVRKDIDLAGPVLAGCLQGKRILVTGGSGCIGSALMAQLARFSPARLVSVSRGITQGWPRLPGAEYVHADIRDADQLAAVFDQAGCDIVFHVAGQRDPGLAEREVHRTVTTNVLGTCNVISAAASFEVPHVIFASTGKALRPYSPEVYTASKRVAEWLLWQAAARGLATCSVARFTHVIDNSIVHARLLDWCDGGVIRLHDTGIAFYVQSALQAAQLLLAAEAGAQPGSLRVHAISDLGWPVTLLDVALGVLAWTGSAAPIYFSGYDRGYEAMPFPGLYDPATAGDVSPLISSFEAASARRSWCPAVDAFPFEVASASALDERMYALADTCARTEEPGPVRAALDELSWSLFDATVSAVPHQVLTRAVRLAAPHRGSLNAVHERMLAAIEQHAAAVNPVSSPRPASRNSAARLR